eukprot:scaffold302753_cov15-Tisochrysis_lutea.AAC.1
MWTQLLHPSVKKDRQGCAVTNVPQPKPGVADVNLGLAVIAAPPYFPACCQKNSNLSEMSIIAFSSIFISLAFMFPL